MTTNTDGAMPELPENIREGAPYDNARFEELCREHDIWGTAESAMCAVFWRTAIQQAAGAVPEGAMDYALDILVAAGHITREKAFQTRDITREFYPPAQRWQVGTWTLTAPDGRTWRADSPLKACSAEQRDRIPPEVALKRIFDALDKGE